MSLTFQEAIIRLEGFWAERGCVIWQPYNVKVGAGTMNPATTLRVLGPEPWNVGYVEPSIRPDDSRYGENPNRMRQHYQYQVILKPDPGNPQELYLESLEALGINRREHDLRFVEDNWESPALGAWGLGWEVWLDGQEITQFTYFQQAGGVNLDPVAVELTYGLERIVIALQRVKSFKEIEWVNGVTYGDVNLQGEVEYSKYNIDYADVERMVRLYDEYEAEAKGMMEKGLVLPAYDYILQCSHTFNILDTRGAIGVTERASYFHRMRDLTRSVAALYLAQRQELGYPLMEKGMSLRVDKKVQPETKEIKTGSGDFVFEIGSEELPATDLTAALEQLETLTPKMLEEARLTYDEVKIVGTPRRQTVYVTNLISQQPDLAQEIRGPAVKIAYDAEGSPTKAALGFARGKGVDVSELERREMEGGEYVVAKVVEKGRPATEILAEMLPQLIADLRFGKTMRWRPGAEFAEHASAWGLDISGVSISDVAYSRPIRWLVALHGDAVVPFEYAGVKSGNVTRGLRPLRSPDIVLPRAEDYFSAMAENDIVVDVEERKARIRQQIDALAAEVNGAIPDNPELLAEVTNLVECPTALRGEFDAEFLELPTPVLIAVMRKHQRYFPIVTPPNPPTQVGGTEGELMPYFIAVRNGDAEHLDIVREGNEDVLRARFADGQFFFNADIKHKLEDFLPRLSTLTFQEKLGSMLDKVKRLENIMPRLCEQVGLTGADKETAIRAAHLSKADLATDMVVELTSLQGIMGRIYAERDGEPPVVARAIFEHQLPRYAGDKLPETLPGAVVGIADKLDSLVGLFAVGLKPTATRDPFALRRAALGLVQVLTECEIDLSLSAAIGEVAQHLPVQPTPEQKAEVIDFISQRQRGLLLDAGYVYDVVDAVLTEQYDNPRRAFLAVAALTEWVKRDDWSHILDTYARCVRITRDFETEFSLHPNKLDDDARKLYNAYRQCQERISPDADVDTFFNAFLPLVPVIAQFFEEVLVMAEDKEVRENRLALLQHIARLPRGITDLSCMEGF